MRERGRKRESRIELLRETLGHPVLVVDRILELSLIQLLLTRGHGQRGMIVITLAVGTSPGLIRVLKRTHWLSRRMLELCLDDLMLWRVFWSGGGMQLAWVRVIHVRM